MAYPPKLFLLGGSANPELNQAIAQQLNTPLLDVRINSFCDGELDIELLQNVRSVDMFIVQSTAAPSERNLMELTLLADACRRASAERVTAVIPYFGYARQDRRVRSARVPISAKVVANMLGIVGIDRVLTVDLHAEQLQGFFNFPVDNIYATSLLIEALEEEDLSNAIVVSPDIGGVVRARAVAKRIGDLDLAIVDKRRSKANQSQVMHIIGEPEGKTCVMVDDIVDTAGTLCQAAAVLKEKGAKRVVAYATHAVLSSNAKEKIQNSALDKLLITDTIPHPDLANYSKISVVPTAKLLAAAIERVNRGASISSLFV